jgi:hypothetical protein
MPIVQYVCSICRGEIVIFYISEVLLISCGYRSLRLSYVGIFARVAFKLIYSTGVLLLSVGLPVANAQDVLHPCGLLYCP